MKQYDYLIVGSGLFGSVFAHEATKHGKKCLVIDKRSHLGGNIYCEDIEGITVHKYGAHIFHTNDKRVWTYVNDLVEFNRYTNSPVANYYGELYNLPFNMNTFNKMWGVVTPEEARAKIEEQKKQVTGEPKNLEEQAISLIGYDIYKKLIKGYTEKQVRFTKTDALPPGFSIAEIKDVVSATTNTLLTPGGVIQLWGSNLKLAGDHPDVGLWFVPETGEAVKATVIVTNKPASLIAMIPSGLTAGNYRLRIATQYSSGSSLLKESRVNVSDKTLKVE